MPGIEGDENRSPEPQQVVIAIVDDEPPAVTFSAAPAAPAAIIPAAVAPGTHAAMDIIPINPFHSMEGAPDAPIVRPHIAHGLEGRAGSICRLSSCSNVSIYRCGQCHRNFCGHHCRIVVAPQRPRENMRKCVECTRREVEHRQRTLRRGGMAQCCVRRLIVRLLVFFILIILASIYSSSGSSASAV